MTKVILINKPEVSVTEEKKGKQIAVKESNITSMKDFYKTGKANFQTVATPTENIQQEPIAPAPIEQVPVQTIEVAPTVENAEQISPTVPVNNIESNPEPENQPIAQITEEEEMDPELQELQERFNQIITELNNYKKKIKKQESEINSNLERSREVLKDTQAAAEIMSIQQERQRQIINESAA